MYHKFIKYKKSKKKKYEKIRLSTKYSTIEPFNNDTVHRPFRSKCFSLNLFDSNRVYTIESKQYKNMIFGIHANAGGHCNVGGQVLEGRVWCNKNDNRFYEICYDTKTRYGNKIPRKNTFYCDYGKETPIRTFEYTFFPHVYLDERPDEYVGPNQKFRFIQRGRNKEGYVDYTIHPSNDLKWSLQMNGQINNPMYLFHTIDPSHAFRFERVDSDFVMITPSLNDSVALTIGSPNLPMSIQNKDKNNRKQHFQLVKIPSLHTFMILLRQDNTKCIYFKDNNLFYEAYPFRPGNNDCHLKLSKDLSDFDSKSIAKGRKPFWYFNKENSRCLQENKSSKYYFNIEVQKDDTYTIVPVLNQILEMAEHNNKLYFIHRFDKSLYNIIKNNNGTFRIQYSTSNKTVISKYSKQVISINKDQNGSLIVELGLFNDKLKKQQFIIQEEQCSITKSNKKILHWVENCNQCGIPFCDGSKWARNEPIMESRYKTGVPLSIWGCNNLKQRPYQIVRNSKDGNIYVTEEPKKEILHFIENCTTCGISWCDNPQYAKDEPNVERHYTMGVPLLKWGCEKLKTNPYNIVRNHQTGRVYVTEDPNQPSRKDILHYITNCGKNRSSLIKVAGDCGINVCDPKIWSKNEPNVERHYDVGLTMKNQNCDFIKNGKYKVVRNSDTGSIYFVKKRSQSNLNLKWDHSISDQANRDNQQQMCECYLGGCYNPYSSGKTCYEKIKVYPLLWRTRQVLHNNTPQRHKDKWSFSYLWHRYEGDDNTRMVRDAPGNNLLEKLHHVAISKQFGGKIWQFISMPRNYAKLTNFNVLEDNWSNFRFYFGNPRNMPKGVDPPSNNPQLDYDIWKCFP